jgi:phospholipid/cholesterol/gamma-HCH transport system substrate-binding protein
VISRQTQLQLLVFLVISVVGLSYTAVRYAGLGKYFLDEGYVVSANFADSGGIFENAEVTYRGVPVGRVEALNLIEDGVQVDLRLRPGTEVPDDLRAVVRNRSAVGEQFVDLQPTRSGEPFLEEGDVIAMENTDLPIQPSELIVSLDDFVTSIDNDDLATTIDELGQAFDDGAGQSLQRIIDSGNALTLAAQDALPETKSLLRDGEVALNTQRDVGDQFKSFNRDLALLTDTLREIDPDFRRLYSNGTASAREVTDLVRGLRPDVPILFDNLITLAQVQKVRLDALQQILVTYPNVVAGGFTVVPGDGTTHFGAVEEQDPPICETGYEDTDEREPEDIRLRTPNFNAGCRQPPEGPSAIRGARNTPLPPSGEVFSGTKDAPPGQGNEQTSSTTASSNSRVPSTGDETVVLGDHDPRTGRVVTQDGRLYTIGSTAGASKVLGGDSWRWLMLGPLSQ